MEVITDVVYDASTAGAIAQDKALLHALPSRRVSYLVGREYGHLREGAPFQVSEAAVSFSSEPCVVEVVEDLGDDTLKLDLLLLGSS